MLGVCRFDSSCLTGNNQSAYKASSQFRSRHAFLTQHRIQHCVKVQASTARESESANQEEPTADSSSQAAVPWEDQFGTAPRKGCDILVQALEREGVTTLFAYPGGASMEIHQALTRSKVLKNVLCRHEQGEIFAAEGYAKSTGQVGVCIATSGPGATNLVTGLADAMLDSVPLVAVTGQVPRKLIGSDAFQETPIVEVTRPITKHNYLVMDVRDIPRIVKEAFFLARTGRPGPVLIDVPKDVQQTMHTPDWSVAMRLAGYRQRLPPPPPPEAVLGIMELLAQAKKPVLYVGGGCLECVDELRRLVYGMNIPVCQTLMGLGVVAMDDDLAMGMLGMHGTVYANYAIDQADLLLAVGVRFDDRVTGKLESFASRAQIVHIDIDPAELNKNKQALLGIASDSGACLKLLNDKLEAKGWEGGGYSAWIQELLNKKQEFPMKYRKDDEIITPQHAIDVLSQETNGEAVITTGVGQHQMWAAQWYTYKQARHWVTSGGLGSMGFGLPSALGAAAAWSGRDGSRGRKTVVDIDGDGSFLMNVQEMATWKVENMSNLKVIILNNQHLGMVVQWEDRFYKGTRAHTYLGLKEGEWHESQLEKDIYPDFVTMAKAYGIKAKRVITVSELRSSIREMLDTDEPYLLDIMVPHIEHVLPMVPGGGSFKDIITEGDGTWEY